MFIIKPFVQRSVRLGLFAALALGALGATACQRKPGTQEADEQVSPPPSPASVKESFETLRAQVKDQVDGYRQLRGRVHDFPVDLIGLSALKAKIGQSESSLGAVAGRTDWLAGELESALKANDGDRIRAVQAQVVSISGDLKYTGASLLEFAHELAPFDEAVTLQTSWVYKLPTGFEIKAAPGGLERRLIDFSADPKRSFEPHSWYRFDRVYFVDIRAEIERERSAAQLTNIVEILRAYPTLKLELSAFDRDQQKMPEIRERTTQRLHVLKKELADRGIATKRLHVLEFGPDCPPEAPERCRGSAAARPMLVL